MKLRDKIALEVLKTHLHNICATNGIEEVDGDDPGNMEYLDSIARGAYDVADAVMRVRKEKK